MQLADGEFIIQLTGEKFITQLAGGEEETVRGSISHSCVRDN